MLCKDRDYVRGSNSGGAGFTPTLYSFSPSLLAPQPLVEGERGSEPGTLTRLQTKPLEVLVVNTGSMASTPEFLILRS